VVRWLTAAVDLTPETAERGVSFWRTTTGWTLSSRRGERSQFVTLLPSSGDPYLRAQTVLAGDGGRHLDLHADDPDEIAARAVSLGALLRHREPGHIVVESPAGLGFCVVRHHGEATRASPVVRADGTRSLVDQVCLDIPAPEYDRECAFWVALTGWPQRRGGRPEFRYLARPAGMPLRLLLQRIDASRAGIHLDLACDDIHAEAAQHIATGATYCYQTEDWVTLRDPAGLVYCLTRRNPDTGTLTDDI
jgi:glyoxalase superfamily protein